MVAFPESEPPIWGRQKGVTPICSGLFRFPRCLPICSNLRSLFSGIPRFVLICSVFFRFVFRTNQNGSGKPLSADPFCRKKESLKRCLGHDSEDYLLLVTFQFVAFISFPMRPWEFRAEVFADFLFCFECPSPEKFAKNFLPNFAKNSAQTAPIQNANFA